jgi:hypothetical protein
LGYLVENLADAASAQHCAAQLAEADFAGGTVNGYTSEFVVVPEPATPIAGVLGLAAAAWCLRRRAG